VDDVLAHKDDDPTIQMIESEFALTQKEKKVT